MLENYFVEPASEPLGELLYEKLIFLHRGNFVSNSRVATDNATGDNDRSRKNEGARAWARAWPLKCSRVENSNTFRFRAKYHQLSACGNNKINFNFMIMYYTDIHTHTHADTLYFILFHFLSKPFCQIKGICGIIRKWDKWDAKLSGSLRPRRLVTNTKRYSQRAGRLISDITIDKSRNNSWLTDCL